MANNMVPLRTSNLLDPGIPIDLTMFHPINGQVVQLWCYGPIPATSH